MFPRFFRNNHWFCASNATTTAANANSHNATSMTSSNAYFSPPTGPLQHSLQSIPKWEDTVPFVPPVSSGICMKVYDGDTITIAAKLAIAGSPLYRFQVRLAGIDCPEMITRSAEEKKMAELAKQEVVKYVLHQPVQLEDVTTEKFGRLLAQVYCTNKETGQRFHLNRHLLDKGLAAPYFGGAKTKHSEEYWMDEYQKQLLASGLWT